MSLEVKQVGRAATHMGGGFFVSRNMGFHDQSRR
jgi:hypothetical protein